MESQSNGSQHPRQERAGSAFEFTCSNCGGKYLAKAGGCPTCDSPLGRRGDEVIKKVDDSDNDLMK